MSHFNLPSIASVGWTDSMTDRTTLDPGGRVCHPVSYDESTETVRVRYPSGSTETWLAKHVTLYLLAEPTPQPGALRTLEEWESAPTNTTIAVLHRIREHVSCFSVQICVRNRSHIWRDKFAFVLLVCHFQSQHRFVVIFIDFYKFNHHPIPYSTASLTVNFHLLVHKSAALSISSHTV